MNNDVDKSCQQLNAKVNKKRNLIMSVFGVGISVSTFK